MKKGTAILGLVLVVGMSAGTSLAQDTMSGNSSGKTSMSSMMNASDTDFANMAAMGGTAEIQMADLAMQRSKSKSTLKYAKKMKKDHTKAGSDLDRVAAKKGMTLSKTPNEMQMKMMEQLKAASETEFDMMYVKVAGVEAHQAMEPLFSTEASNGSDADLKAFAAKTLPVVQMHLRMAQDMANGGMMSNDKKMKSDMKTN